MLHLSESFPRARPSLVPYRDDAVHEHCIAGLHVDCLHIHALLMIRFEDERATGHGDRLIGSTVQRARGNLLEAVHWRIGADSHTAPSSALDPDVDEQV